MSVSEAEVSKPVVIEDSQELDQNEDEQLRRETQLAIEASLVDSTGFDNNEREGNSGR